MPDPMTPQAYPLWCAAVHHDESDFRAGRVVGWVRDPELEDEVSGDHAPIVAFVDRHGTPRRVTRPLDDDYLFFAENRRAAVDVAVEWMNRDRPYRVSVPAEVWGDTGADVVERVRHGALERLGLDLIGDPKVTHHRGRVSLTWATARRKVRHRLNEEGYLVDVRPSPDFEGTHDDWASLAGLARVP